MKIDPPLEQAKFIGRYKRFFADIELADGSTLTIHCPNTGSMQRCMVPRAPCWFSRSTNPKRKLPGTLELVTTASGQLAGVNTSRPNYLIAEAINAGEIAELRGYRNMSHEVGYGEENSRIDLLLTSGLEKCFIEIKNVTLEGVGGLARFPDAVTARGAKHLRELIRVIQGGQRAVLVYCVQLNHADRVAVAADIDPVYADVLREALAIGVEVLAYGCKLTSTEIVVDRKLAVNL